MIELSRVGLGTNNFGRRLDRERSIEVVHAALDAGVTHIDTANIYGGGESERFIGEALEDRRDEAFLATKFGMGEGGNGSPELRPPSARGVAGAASAPTTSTFSTTTVPTA